MALYVSVLNEPAFELGVAPGRPDGIREAVVVVFHVLDEGCASGIVSVGDYVV